MNLDNDSKAVIAASKDEWNKPEVTLLGVNTQTLGTSSLHGFDHGAFPISSS